MTFSIFTDKTGVSCIAIRGRLEGAAVTRLRDQLEEMLAGRRPRIVVDLLHLRCLGDAAVDLLVATHRRCEQQGGFLALMGLTGQPRAVLKLMQLDRVLANEETDLL